MWGCVGVCVWGRMGMCEVSGCVREVWGSVWCVYVDVYLRGEYMSAGEGVCVWKCVTM